jgi:hypothetical protein
MWTCRTARWLAACVGLSMCQCGGETTGPRFGTVKLLPSDPEPPALPPNALLAMLLEQERSALCDWVADLKRPEIIDCPEDYYNKGALWFACTLTRSDARPSCTANVEHVVECAVRIANCSATARSPGCRALQSLECAPDAPD